MNRSSKTPVVTGWLKRCQLLMLLTCLSACASLPENLIGSPDVSLNDVQVVGLGFKGQTFLLSFDIQNPNAFPLPVRNIAYGLRLDGQRFASGETSSDFTVPANGRTSFAISVELDLLQTAPQLLSIVRNGTRRDIRYEIDGRLGVDIPLAPEVRYNNSGTVRLSSSGY